MHTMKPKKRILLGLLPFWTPLIPSMAPSYLKGYLQKYGYHVRVVDLNIEVQFKEFYHKYFDKLKKFIEEGKRVNFYNIGHDVLQNHMMAHINYKDETEYIELVKIIVHQNYYVDIWTEAVIELNNILDEFYGALEKYLVALIEEEKPDVFGLTAYNHTLPACLFAFRFVKRAYPHITTMMGGGIFIWQMPLGTSEFDFLLEKTKDSIDKLVVGEGQHLFLKYLEGELCESQRVYTRADIEGRLLAFEEVGLPDISDLYVDQYPYLATVASGSCPYECTFCTIKRYFGEHKVKYPKLTVDEMMELSRKYGKNVFLMMDSLINPHIDVFSHELLKRDKVLYWDAYLRVGEDVCNIENTLKWRRAGLMRARIGTESGSQRMLDMMDKRITLDMTRKSLASLAHAGIKTTTFWVIGYPGETEEDFRMTLDFVEELKDDIYEAEFNPFTYFYSTQTSHEEWAKNAVLLYPESAKDMLISQTWIVNLEPYREEVFQRLNRFVEHCTRLGIPNPYSLNEIFQADERWKRLHPNAVPSLVELTGKNIYLDECRNIEKLLTVKNTQLTDATFDF